MVVGSVDLIYDIPHSSPGGCAIDSGGSAHLILLDRSGKDISFAGEAQAMRSAIRSDHLG
jgi:hypothetical protein